MKLLPMAVAAGIVAGGLSVLAAPAAAALPPGFTDTVAIGGLNAPTSVVFAPTGRVFVGEKSGVVKTFDSLSDSTATVTADLRRQTHNYWDRGLLGMTLDPAYPTRPYLYVLYTHDAEPGGTAPRWGDICPSPPGPTEQGCVVTGRLSRLTLDANGVATSETPLVTDWCQQYPSHSIGTVTFGPDGYLYVSAGDGASFNFADWGQRGNPCADPPGPAGTNLSPPNAQGGALRSQSPRRAAGYPVVPNGTILRVDPTTGARQPIAHGLRNPFRFAFRPGTEEVWIADVGWNGWEEVNRIPDATDGVVENFGWPCYEGPDRQAGYDNANLTMCESLYTVGHNVPYYAYRHADAVVPGDGCTGGSSVSSVAFESTSSYPPAYDGALFFADSSRGCIWAMRRGPNGQPNPATIVPFVTGVNAPVQVLFGPGGDLFYVALGSGQLRRVSFPEGHQPPTAVATADPTSGSAPLTVRFSGAGSSDPNPGTLTYAWDLDGDGQYDDSTSATPSWTYLERELVPVGLRVTDPEGLSGTDMVAIAVDNPSTDKPIPVISNPTASVRWAVGQTVPFVGSASDAQDGPLPASALSWQLTMQHCTTSTNCHAHNVQSWTGVASGSFVAPDHEYPSYLDLTLRATDSDGNVATTTVRLNPRTVVLTFESKPLGARLTVGSATQVTPFRRTVIVGSNNSVSAPVRMSPGIGGPGYGFTSWSDRGTPTHNLVAPATPTTYRAYYRLCVPGC